MITQREDVAINGQSVMAATGRILLSAHRATPWLRSMGEAEHEVREVRQIEVEVKPQDSSRFSAPSPTDAARFSSIGPMVSQLARRPR